MSSDNGESADDHRVESVLGFKYKLEVFIFCLGAERLGFEVFFLIFLRFALRMAVSQCLPANS